MTLFWRQLAILCVAGVALTGLMACDNAGNHVVEYDCEAFDVCDYVPPSPTQCVSTCDGTIPLVCNSTGDLVRGTDCANLGGVCENGLCVAGVPADKWIGSPCECTPDDPDKTNGCMIGTIPLPSPIEGDGITGSIKGCENLSADGYPGAKVVCFRTISKDSASMAPPVYFPSGYCTLSAVGCDGSTFCSTAAYGDVKQMDTCPKGTVMMKAPFNYAIMGDFSKIEDKLCLKSCKEDSDCNPEGEVYCVEREGLKFCYNETNFEFLGDKITYQQF